MRLIENVPRLRFDRVSKTYDGNMVVSDLSLEVSPGQVTCLLGPSGCGKSTTLRIAAGVERQDSGEVYLNGQMISSGTKVHLSPEDRSIGLMFQDFALFPHLNVFQNISFGINSSGKKREVTERLIKKIGLLGFEEKYPHMLSGGEQQRVALARAMAT